MQSANCRLPHQYGEFRAIRSPRSIARPWTADWRPFLGEPRKDSVPIADQLVVACPGAPSANVLLVEIESGGPLTRLEWRPEAGRKRAGLHECRELGLLDRTVQARHLA